MASLQKIGIVHSLRNRGFSISSVQKLNKIMEEMGILSRCGNGWLTTTKGLKHSIYSNPGIINADLWHETIVDAIANYLKKK